MSIALVAVLAFVGHLAGCRIEDGDKTGLGEPDFPPGGPAEFLYLDEEKVAAYLAQVNGGSFDAETVTNKLADSLDANVSVPGGPEASASQATETSVQREVKPTDASNFFSLRAGLIAEEELEEIGLRYFRDDVRSMEQGTFVTFRTTGLISPKYLNAYLAVRQDHTVVAMFPNSKKRRTAANSFSNLVGPDPRVTFALRPREEVGSKVVPTPFVYLLPMDASRLTAERSLLKFGGGRFTVLGKVVRIFPENKKHNPAYIDSPTRETWEQPLLRAPGELLCRTDPICSEELRTGGLNAAERRQKVDEARNRALRTLRDQTQIKKQGAVILPIAIYK